jgi:hypothetical protein
MFRRLYLASLVLLQFVLIERVAPRALAALGGVMSSAGAMPDGWLALVEIAGTALALGGTALPLAAPSLTLLRHRQCGDRRFGGVPRWGAAVTVAGAALFVAAAAPWWLAPLLPVEWRVDVLLATEPCAEAGMALMAAGALCAELLRRGARPATTGPEVVSPQRVRAPFRTTRLPGAA